MAAYGLFATVDVSDDLDRRAAAPDQIRTIIPIFGDPLFTEIFSNRTNFPRPADELAPDVDSQTIASLSHGG